MTEEIFFCDELKAAIRFLYNDIIRNLSNNGKYNDVFRVFHLYLQISSKLS